MMMNTQNGKMRTYVVDDEAVVQMTLGKLLESEDFPVETYGSAEEFLEGASVEEPHLLIVDKNLPGISGLDLVAKQQLEGRSFEAILITGYADLDSAIHGVRLDLYSYIKKPFDFERLLTDVEGAAERLREKQHLLGSKPGIEGISTDLLQELFEPVWDAEIRLGSVLKTLQDIKISEPMRDDLDHAYERLLFVENMLEQQLANERIKRSAAAPQVRPIGLLSTVENVSKELNETSQKARIPIWLETKEEVEVLADLGLLRQMIKSMFLMALEHGERGNPVVIDVEEERSPDLDRDRDQKRVTMKLVVMGHHAMQIQDLDQQQLEFCRSLAKIQQGDLSVSSYLDDMGFQLALTLPRKL